MNKRIREPDVRGRVARTAARTGTDAQLEEYARHRDPTLREQLVLRYQPLVRQVAARLGERLPTHVDRADLVSVGTLGLLEALDRFDPGRGKPFEPYAVARIKGAMVDELRSWSGMPRTYWAKRREVSKVAAALSNALGRRPAFGEMAAATGLPAAEVRELYFGPVADPAVLDTLTCDDAARLGEATPADPEQHAVDVDARSRLLVAVDRLPDRLYQIVEWHYRDDRTFAQIAERLRITESRVAQLHAQALRELRRRL